MQLRTSRWVRIAVVLAAAAELASQTAPGIDPAKSTKDETIEYTSRSALSMRAGRIATALAPGFYAGVRSLRSFVFIEQDQDYSTQESFTFEVRDQDPATGFPD